MTRMLFRFLVPATLLAMSAFAQSNNAASPAAPTGTKVGIISIQDAIVASNEGQRDLSALQKKFEPKQTELNALSKEIEALQTQLRTQGDKMNDDARAALVKSIEAKQKTLQRQGEDAQSDYQTQQSEIATRIGGKMMDVIDKYAKQNGYVIIIDVSNPQSGVLWAAANTNVTKDIVDAYNTQSGVAAPVPAAGQAGASPATPRPQTSRPPASPPPARPATPKQ